MSKKNSSKCNKNLELELKKELFLLFEQIKTIPILSYKSFDIEGQNFYLPLNSEILHDEFNKILKKTSSNINVEKDFFRTYLQNQYIFKALVQNNDIKLLIFEQETYSYVINYGEEQNYFDLNELLYIFYNNPFRLYNLTLQNLFDCLKYFSDNIPRKLNTYIRLSIILIQFRKRLCEPVTDTVFHTKNGYTIFYTKKKYKLDHYKEINNNDVNSWHNNNYLTLSKYIKIMTQELEVRLDDLVSHEITV